MIAEQKSCFVLWGQQCDELAATLFITKLRAAGIRVGVVGIGGSRSPGAHGLGLVTDTTLEQALSRIAQVAAVIIPCRGDQLLHFLNDPRLILFLHDCLINQVPLLLASEGMPTPAQWQRAGVEQVAETIECYPPTDQLAPFIQTFAATLRRTSCSQ